MTAFSFMDGTAYDFMDGTGFDFMDGGVTPVVVELGVATETDSGLGIGWVQAIELGLASETDSALTVGAALSQVLGIAEETDSVLPFSSIGFGYELGLATETDTGLSWSFAFTRTRYNLFFEEHLKPIYTRGKIILNRPISDGQQLVVLRNTPIYTTFEAVDAKPWPVEEFEYTMDRACYIEQELEGHLCACPTYPDYPGIPPLTPTVTPELDSPECLPYDCTALDSVFALYADEWWKLQTDRVAQNDAPTNNMVPSDGNHQVNRTDWSSLPVCAPQNSAIVSGSSGLSVAQDVTDMTTTFQEGWFACLVSPNNSGAGITHYITADKDITGSGGSVLRAGAHIISSSDPTLWGRISPEWVGSWASVVEGDPQPVTQDIPLEAGTDKNTPYLVIGEWQHEINHAGGVGRRTWTRLSVNGVEYHNCTHEKHNVTWGLSANKGGFGFSSRGNHAYVAYAQGGPLSTTAYNEIVAAYRRGFIGYTPPEYCTFVGTEI